MNEFFKFGSKYYIIGGISELLKVILIYIFVDRLGFTAFIIAAIDSIILSIISVTILYFWSKKKIEVLDMTDEEWNNYIDKSGRVITCHHR